MFLVRSQARVARPAQESAWPQSFVTVIPMHAVRAIAAYHLGRTDGASSVLQAEALIN
jgi:hypothetical protein